MRPGSVCLWVSSQLQRSPSACRMYKHIRDSLKICSPQRSPHHSLQIFTLSDDLHKRSNRGPSIMHIPRKDLPHQVVFWGGLVCEVSEPQKRQNTHNPQFALAMLIVYFVGAVCGLRGQTLRIVQGRGRIFRSFIIHGSMHVQRILCHATNCIPEVLIQRVHESLRPDLIHT